MRAHVCVCVCVCVCVRVQLIYLFFSCLTLQALDEKAKGNAAYKQKDFATALSHYEKAWELDPTNITILKNRAGGLACFHSFLTQKT